MEGEIAKIISRGCPGAESGIVASARESGDVVEIVRDLNDGVAKSDAVLVVCDKVLDWVGKKALGLCRDGGKPCEVCSLACIHNDMFWLPILETARQIDMLVLRSGKRELTLYVCGSLECDAPGISRKAKALFDRGMYCAKSHAEWEKRNGLSAKFQHEV